MANRTEQLGIKITADANGVNAEINKVIGNVKKLGDAGRSSSNSLRTMGSAATVAAQALGTLGVAISVRGMYETIASFEKLNASLKTVTGSVKSATDAMTMIRQFAAETPYDVQQVTEAFIRLRSLGLDATTESLRSYGNTAAAMGKPMMQFIEAVADATTNEFERLKEFGIKAKQEGDQITLTFRGVSTTIRKDASEIEKYLKRMGEVEFSGGMAEQMNTMEGALSNLKDAFANLVDYIGNLGISRLIRQDFQVAAEILDSFTKSLNATFGTGIQSKIDGMTVSVRSLKDEIADMQAVKGTLWDRIFGTSTDLEQRKAELADMQARLTGLQAQQRTMTGNVGASTAPLAGARSATSVNGNARIISAASARLGQSERNPGDMVKFLNEHSGTVFRNLTVPWCARYVSAVLNSSGVGGLKTARARDYLGFGQSAWTPNMGAAGLSRAQPGDIAVFARGKGMGHVGFIKSADPRTGRMQILGGNQSDAVTVSNRSTNGLLGIRRATGKSSDFESAETFARKEQSALASAYKKQQEDRKRAQEEYKRQQEDAYQLFADRLDRQARLTDTTLQVDASKQKLALEKLGNEYDDWERKNQLQIEVAFDQKSYQDQIRLINEAQAKSEQYIRGMNRLSGGDDSAAVRSLEKEIALIDEKIAKVKATTRDETEIEKLKDERVMKTKEREKALIESQSGNLELQRSLAENAAKYDGMREEAGKRIIEVQNQQAEQAQKVGGLTAEAAKSIVDSHTQQLESQIAINAAQREAELNNRQDLSTIDKQREAIKGRMEDTIKVAAAEKQAAIDKLRIDQVMLGYEHDMLEARMNATNDMRERAQLQAELAQNEIKQAIARAAAANIESGYVKKVAEARAEMENATRNLDNQAVKEEQLRMNAFWDQYMGRLNDYANLWQEITGSTQDGFSKMTLAMGEYSKQVQQIGQLYRDENGAATDWAKSLGGMAPAMEGLQQGQAALAAMAKTMIALRSNYAEGTKGYNDMTSAAERMMEVQRALQVVEGVLAVIHQLSAGDVYTAVPRALGVLAMIGSLGVSVGSAGGMSNGAARRSSQTGGSTAMGGGVFGDTSTKSESISKSLEIVAQNSNANLAYSAGMLRSLKNIELAIAGTTNAIIRGVKPEAVSGLGQKNFNVAIDPLQIGKLLGSGVYTKISNWGIKALPQQLDQIIAKGFQGMNWTEVTKTTKILGITIGKSVKNLYSALDTGVAGQITRVIRGMADSVREAGKAFGISGEQFMSAMKGFTVNFGTLATKGLKGTELQDAVQQVFSSMSDDMAQAFQSRFELNLEPFMQSGEGMFQTLVRVADGINVATGMLAQAGLEAINYQNIVMKQGDVAAEIVRQSIVMFEGAGSAIGAYVDQAVGSAEELITVYRDLLTMSDVAKTIGFGIQTLTNDMVVFAGGVSNFLASLQTYQADILGVGDYASQMIGLNREFKKLGLAVPQSNEAFVMLVDSINTSSEAGAKLYAQIMNLAGAFAKAKKAAADVANLLDKYNTDPMKAYKQRVTDVQSDFAKIIDGILAGMPGGPDFIAKSQKITTLTNRITDRVDDRKKKEESLAKVQGEIDLLKAKDKLTAAEKARLQNLQVQKAAIKQGIKGITDEIEGYQTEIKRLNKLIAENPNNANLIAERNKLLVQQGDALLSTLSDIFDQINQSVANARDALQGIRDNIYELSGEVGGPNAKAENATIRLGIAENAYNAYKGDDITKRTDLANRYREAIMGEYEAKKAAIMATQEAIEKERDARQKAHDKEIDALQKQLDKVRELNDAVKAIQKYSLSLKLGSQSTLSPQDRLREAANQYQSLLARAQTGDVSAMQDLSDGASNYLEAAQRYYGSGTQYATIFDGVSQAMEQLGAMNPGDADSIQARIDALNTAHAAYLESIDQRIADLHIEDQITALQAATVTKLQALEDSFAPAVEAAADQAKQQMKDLIELARAQNILNADQLTALNNLAAAAGVTGYTYQDPNAPKPSAPKPETNNDGGITKPAKPSKPSKPAKPLNPIDDPAKYDGPSVYKTWNDYWKQQLQIWKNHPEWGQTWSQFKIDEFQRLQLEGKHPVVPAFANGGMANTGWAMVGERGPELVKFGAPAMVYDAERTMKMLREMASFQPMPKQQARPINMEVMPRTIDDMPKQREMARLSQEDVVAELKTLRTEMAALVTTQSGANPQIINRLERLEAVIASMARDQKIKPTARA